MANLLTEPTATITISGLAICGLTRNTIGPRRDVAFLRAPKHDFTLQVNGEAFSIPAHCQIVIRANNPVDQSTPHPLGHFAATAPIDRKVKPTGGPFPFDWLVNFEDTIDTELALPHLVSGFRPAVGVELTFAYIYDAVFYAKSIGQDRVAIQPLGANPNFPTVATPPDFGELGFASEDIGAEIACETDGKVIVQVLDMNGDIINQDGADLSWSLDSPTSGAAPHTIELANAEPPPTWLSTDFHLYYQVFDARFRYDLWGECGKDQAVGCVCNGVGCSQSMNPLPGYNSLNHKL